jgi:hypothetical protein
MSFQPDKTLLKSAFAELTQQASSTTESWGDPVQRRFYGQFIDSLPREFMAFINAVDKLDKSFERAEQNISGLQG